MEELKTAVRRFLRRDWQADVSRLNREFARAGASSAGFVDAPPSVLTGSPYALVPGSCIGIIGLNPMWHANALAEAARTAAELRNGRIDGYERRRANYFADDSREYNWRHFTRLGNRIRNSPLNVQAESARSVFRDHAFVMDLLPWWSVDIACIDAQKLTPACEPVAAWQGVPHAFVEHLRPRLLLVHGNAFVDFAEGLLGAQLVEFRYCGNRRAWRGRTATGVPVLVHGQVTAINGPQSDDSYRELVRSWQTHPAPGLT